MPVSRGFLQKKLHFNPKTSFKPRVNGKYNLFSRSILVSVIITFFNLLKCGTQAKYMIFNPYWFLNQYKNVWVSISGLTREEHKNSVNLRVDLRDESLRRLIAHNANSSHDDRSNTICAPPTLRRTISHTDD